MAPVLTNAVLGDRTLSVANKENVQAKVKSTHEMKREVGQKLKGQLVKDTQSIIDAVSLYVSATL